jgi:hypothetical protein
MVGKTRRPERLAGLQRMYCGDSYIATQFCLLFIDPKLTSLYIEQKVLLHYRALK